jgi:hypothetical protein
VCERAAAEREGSEGEQEHMSAGRREAELRSSGRRSPQRRWSFSLRDERKTDRMLSHGFGSFFGPFGRSADVRQARFNCDLWADVRIRPCPYIHAHACIHARTHACTHARIHARTHACIEQTLPFAGCKHHTCMSTSIHADTHTSIMRACTHPRAHIHTYMRADMHAENEPFFC